MKLFGTYDSPSTFSRSIMAAGDALSWLIEPRRPVPMIPLLPDRIRSLLILRLDGIGDNICSWPALELLRCHLPKTRITLAVGPWAAPLYRECPWIYEVLEWDSGLFGLFRGKGLSGLPEDLRRATELRGRFDAGIDLRGDLLSILLLRIVAPPIRIAHVLRGGKHLLTDPLDIHCGTEAQRTNDVIQIALGLPADPVSRVQDWPRPKAREQAIARLAAAGWDSTLPSVALCPLALWPWKQWPKERFRELATLLKKNFGLQVIWFLEHGVQADSDASNDTVFCGTLDEVAAAMGECRLAVSNDSGLLHLAVAAGCKAVQLFGPGDAARFAHTGEGLILHHDTSCKHYPCTQRGTCVNLSEGWCLEKIRVEDVYASCRLLMKDVS